MRFIWFTRGWNWGSRFLRDGGLEDPLPEYEHAFAGIEDKRQAWQRVDDVVAVRFLDPEGRRDRSGRLIFHDFVLFGLPDEAVRSVEDGKDLVWPRVSVEYAALWNGVAQD